MIGLNTSTMKEELRFKKIRTQRLAEKNSFFYENSGYTDQKVIRRKALIERALAHLPNKQLNNSWLDIGTHNGNFIKKIAPNSYRIIGIDESSDICKLAFNQSSTINVVNSEATTLPFPDNSFSVVSALGVFSFNASWEAIVSEMHRVLAPGGIGIIEDSRKLNLLECISSLIENGFSSKRKYKAKTILSFSFPDLKKFLRKSEFVNLLSKKRLNRIFKKFSIRKTIFIKDHKRALEIYVPSCCIFMKE